MNSAKGGRPTWSEIDLENLIYNFNSSKRFIGTEVKYMAMVKADAYGHGAVPCSLALEAAGIDWFGVALLEEGSELRDAGISRPILCLGGFGPGDAELILAKRLTPAIFALDQAEVLDRSAGERGIVVDVHVKIDTGMGRVGVRYDRAAEFAEQLLRFRNIRVQGMMTHFAAADRPEEKDFTAMQIRRFDECVRTFRGKGFEPAYLDLANSPASVAYPESRGNMVRLGGMLYGLGEDVLPPEVRKPDLRPVLTLKSRISLLKDVPAGDTLGYGRTFKTERDSRIATLPIGYHDGYRRIFSNKARVLVNGTFAPVVGRISMDWTIIDVTDAGDVRPGNEVILIGEAGGNRISAADLAALADTISYEITCGISRRVRRIIVG